MSTSEHAARYCRVASAFTAVVSAVPDDSWQSPSPCEGWTALDVVRHVVETERDLVARMPFAPAAHDPVMDTSTDPRVAWAAVRDFVQGALDDPQLAGHAFDGFFGPTTFAATIDAFYSMDLLVHRWDIARATGLKAHEQLDGDLVDHFSAGMVAAGDAVRMPGIFGPEIAARPDASRQDRFLAWTGRRPEA